MRRIRNPFLENDGYHCFGCSPNNDLGLRMEFFETEDGVESLWNPQPHFEGFNSVLHGGVQAALMDEIASWHVFVKLETAGVTSGMSVDFHRPVFTNRGALQLRTSLDRMEKNVAHVRVELLDPDDRLCAVGVCRYFTYPPAIARKRLDYPGHEAFY